MKRLSLVSAKDYTLYREFVTGALGHEGFHLYQYGKGAKPLDPALEADGFLTARDYHDRMYSLAQRSNDQIMMGIHRALSNLNNGWANSANARYGRWKP